MSLINDALKKAQKQRTGESPPLVSLPSVGGESPQRIARRAKPPGFDTLMVRAGIGGAVVLVLAIGGYFLLRDKSPSGGPVSAPAASANVGGTSRPDSAPSSLPADAKHLPGDGSDKSRGGSSQQRESAGQTPGSQQGTTVQPSPAPATPTFTLPTAPSPGGGPVSAPAASANVGGTSRPDAPVASSAPTPQPTTNNQQPAPISAPAPKLEPRAIEFIENIKVAGIRASATDAKVLMNDRVYRPGSMVSAEFGLKLVEIASDSLTFEDDKGGRYTRTF
jgi:hypothetical protein